MRLFTLLLLAAVAGCTSIDTKDQISTLPKLTFAQLQPLPVDVETVMVKSDVPDVSGTSPIQHTNVSEAFGNYARQRFVGQGGIGAGTLTVTLNETRITKATENTDNKWTAWTNLDKIDSYKVAIKSTMRFDAATGGLFKTATLQQERGIDLPQRVSLAERQRLEQEMVERLIADLDKQAITALQTQLNVMGAR